MSYKVHQGDIFGRVGTSIGKSLAESIPKETERLRLSQGLQDLEKEGGNLTPFQQYSRLAAIPGITPQMIQSGSELLKQQGVRDAFRDRGNVKSDIYSPEGITPTESFRKVEFGGGKLNKPEQPVERGQPLGKEQIVPKGPTSPELKTYIPWTPEQREMEIQKEWDKPQYQNLTFPEISKIVDDKETRLQSMPEAAQKEYKREQTELDDAKKRFREDLELKLEKTGPGVYTDISGENIAALEQEMNRYMAMHPEVSKNDAADMFSKKGLDLARTKSHLKTLAKEGGFQHLVKQKDNFDKLKSYQKSFKDAGQSQEFYDILTTKNGKDRYGFGMSPQGAASIAYPLSKQANDYIKGIRFEAKNVEKQSIKYALEIEDKITREDSLLAISKAIQDRFSPFFDQNAFFNQLREDRDNLGLSNRQKEELSVGESDWFPNWGDISILPIFRGNK